MSLTRDDSQTFIEEVTCTCSMSCAPDPLAFHGDPGKFPAHCRCTCSICDERREAWPGYIERLLYAAPTEAEVERGLAGNYQRDLRRDWEQHKAKMQAWRNPRKARPRSSAGPRPTTHGGGGSGTSSRAGTTS